MIAKIPNFWLTTFANHPHVFLLGEEDEEKRAGLVGLLVLTKRVLEICIEILGFEAPERM